MAEVQKTTRRHQKFHGRVKLLADRRSKRARVGPFAQLTHRRNKRQPASDVVIPEPARCFLYIRLEVEYGFAKLRVPLACDLRQTLQQCFRFTHYQLGNQFVAKACEELAVSSEIAAIEQRDGEFGIVRIEAITFGKAPRSRTQLEL